MFQLSFAKVFIFHQVLIPSNSLSSWLVPCAIFHLLTYVVNPLWLPLRLLSQCSLFWGPLDVPCYPSSISNGPLSNWPNTNLATLSRAPWAPWAPCAVYQIYAQLHAHMSNTCKSNLNLLPNTLKSMVKYDYLEHGHTNTTYAVF